MSKHPNGPENAPSFSPLRFFTRLVGEGMDPEEAEAVVRVHTDRFERAQAGQAEADAESGGPGKLASALAGFGQGASGGFSDELAGVLTAIPRLLPGGESPKEAFRRGVDEQRGFVDESREAHPFITGAADVVGAIAAPGAVANLGKKALGKGAQLIGRQAAQEGGRRAARTGIQLLGERAVRGGATAGGIGFAQGAGRAEGGIGERIEGGVVPGLIGLAAGSLLGPVIGAKADKAGLGRATRLEAEAATARTIAKAEREVAEAAAKLRRVEAGAVRAERQAEMATLKLRQAEATAGRQALRSAPRPAAPVTQDPVAQALATPRIGQPSVSGRPDLGVTVKAGRTQKAAPATRSASRVEPEIDEGAARQMLQASGRTAEEATSEAPQIVRQMRGVASWLERASTEQIEQHLAAAEQGSALFPDWAVTFAKQVLSRRLAAA